MPPEGDTVHSTVTPGVFGARFAALRLNPDITALRVKAKTQKLVVVYENSPLMCIPITKNQRSRARLGVHFHQNTHLSPIKTKI